MGKAISVLAPRMHAVLGDCAAAAHSVDARDKYFAVGVKEWDSSRLAAYEQEVPALESAAASLGVTLSELSAAIPNLPMCTASSLLSNGGAPQTQSMLSRSAARVADLSGWKTVDV